MDKPLADWLIPWLNRPGWQLLAAQWLVLAGFMLLASTLFLSGEWQQQKRLHEQRQQLELQITERQQQLSQLPAQEELQQRLQQQKDEPLDESEDLGNQLNQVGGVLLRWQQQGKPAQHKVRLLATFDGVLHVLSETSPVRRISQMRMEMQPEGLITQLTFLALGEETDE